MKGSYLTVSPHTRLYYRHHLGTSLHPLIFLHGLGGNMTAWCDTVHYFHQQGYTTYTLDLRGHGRSSRSNQPNYYHIDHFAADLHSFITLLQINQPIIIGHSFGGITAIQHAVSYPDDLVGLVLAGSYSQPPSFARSSLATTAISTLCHLFSPFFNQNPPNYPDYRRYKGTSDWDIVRILSDIRHTTPRAYFEICQQILHFDITAKINQISVPTLIVSGTEDSIFTPQTASKLHDQISNSTMEIIPHANHILVVNQPDSLELAIKHFITTFHTSSHTPASLSP